MNKDEFKSKLKYSDDEIRSAMAHRKHVLGGRLSEVMEEFNVSISMLEAGVGHEAYYEMYGEQW